MNQSAQPSGVQVLLATNNQGKIREILDILADLPIQFHRLSEFPDVDEPIESGSTFEENAYLKASYYAHQTHLVTLAEDSGLEVDALGGDPGVRSARFAGKHGEDGANNAKVINLMRNVQAEKRTARFRCVCVLASADERIAKTEGVIEGRILDELRGTNGFGYDPLFLVPELGKTTAEITRDQKNRISHRGNALRAMKEQIVLWLNTAKTGRKE